VYNVIEKRRQELIDLASGMDELCLVKYLKVHYTMAAAMFPRQAEAVIDNEEVKSRIVLQNDKHPQGQVMMDSLYRFIDEISQDADGKLLIPRPFGTKWRHNSVAVSSSVYHLENWWLES